MQGIVKYKGLTLIQKYGQHYIRFWGGQHEETLCDLLITEEETQSILVNPEEIKNIRDVYKRKCPWTKEYFANSAMKDELIFRSNSTDWKYIKPLSNEESIAAFERMTAFALPESFKVCVKQYNGARPKCRAFDTEKQIKREMKSLLSFNRDDRETVWGMYDASYTEHKGQYIPFAIDHFGNLICFDRSGQIVFIDHETLNVELVAPSFEKFMDDLYITATYYKDDDHGHIVRNIKGYGVECLRKGCLKWEICGTNSNYYRELFIGEGNNCLSSISCAEALNLISEWSVSE